ncbi:MAG: transporter substrate-binding domain-containing protein [Ignavibacteria bacterium]|nr:transporter substrate-binding domain-containing protein [Ignavibacteria bacterium]MBT8383646.1 transporter substrate-binding domain-containing protein [Ignavibacteria bacterium]MBT8390763.1 transporter substrate-binding domain-containing protein [Ignavibacteria bacterium]NNJ53649.1 transporter substrate-binding domain-containing protein [Ignavibacteriaceae bacterium]NNL22353.1 transporter substrate-binding domain-containing protein [Ignavibacteriaceae bacterium]
MTSFVTKMLPILFRGLILFSLIALNSCNDDSSRKEKTELDRILSRDTLRVLTGYNAYSYFIYKGQPMGFEYDLVNKLAEYLKIKPEFIIVKKIDDMFRMVNKGKGDLVAFNLTITKDRLEMVDFTRHHYNIRQVLVQRKPENWRRMMTHKIENQLIRDPAELIGDTIVVRSGSSFIPRLKNLSDEIGGDIIIKTDDPELTTEELIEMVAEGKIKFTISDDNVANQSAAFFNNIDVKTPVSLVQRAAWVVKKNSQTLLDTINYWLDSIKSTEYFAVTYNKYFKNRYAYKRRVKSELLSVKGTSISKYDDLIKKYLYGLNWDWRIVASQMYQESQFNPNAKSWAGAVGLMQLLTSTGEMFGVSNLFSPEANIKAGLKFLKYLDSHWKKSISDSLERIKFVLASYNVGWGHIEDAQRLCEKYGASPNIWFDNVEYYLLQKSKPKYYNDEVVRNGYSRGRETVAYVKEILDRYEHYKKFFD